MVTRSNIINLTCLLISFQIFSQTINCNIKSDSISLTANIIYKEVSNPEVIKEYSLTQNGHSSYKLKKNYDNILIEVNAHGYFSKSIIINKPDTSKTYTFEIYLRKDETMVLDDVVIVAKQKFRIREDTISYNVSSYSDGSERRIEEIIKKLPGIDVNDKTGKITYKGKSVETVTLEGDNLFRENYVLGTKNINVDMVEQIQAIENYSENPLLKGIEQGGKVSLNLKLKKGKFDLSGDVDAEIGLFNEIKPANNLNGNLLGISKNYKSFGILSYNNIGINNTPFDYFGMRFSAMSKRESRFMSKKIIPEAYFTSILDNEKININNQIFANYNSIFKIGKKWRLKTNLYFLKDRIENHQTVKNFYRIDNESFSTTNGIRIAKKPLQYRIDLELKYNLSKTSLLEYEIRLFEEYIETKSLISHNNDQEMTTNLESDNFFFKQSLKFTKRLSNSMAFLVSLYQSSNSIPQIFLLKSSQHDTFVEKTQKSELDRNTIEVNSSLLGTNKNDKYGLVLGVSKNKNLYYSNLINTGGNNMDSLNNLEYIENSIFHKGVYNFKRGKWQISPQYSLKAFQQKLKYKTEAQTSFQNKLIFEPSLRMIFKINPVSFISGNFDYSQNPISNKHLFKNPVIIDSRTTISNTPSLELQMNESYSIYYINNDMYHQFEMNIGFSLLKSNGNIFSNSTINESVNEIKYFFSPHTNLTAVTNFKISKYVSWLKSRIQLNSSYSTTQYKNIVNNSDLKQNRSHSLNHRLFLKTAFKTFVNFENSLSWNHSISKREEMKSFTNNSIFNNFKFILNPSKKWYFLFSSEYYVPDLEQPMVKFAFLNANFHYFPKNDKWETRFSVKNLLNENNFETVHTSNISRTIWRTNLLSRHFLVDITYNF